MNGCVNSLCAGEHIKAGWLMGRVILYNGVKRSALLLIAYVLASMSALVLAQSSFNFNSSGLKGVVLTNPTSLQFGPDRRLYVSQQNGVIKALTITRSSANDYSVTNTETISIINSIPNHNDNGTLASGVTTRQVTGILVTGTPSNPILYVSSSDSRIGGPNGDLNLDTNSGVISRLTRVNGVWTKLDLVRGLPRSEENHSVNGMQLDVVSNVMYLAIGGSTNAGGPSANFALLTEYALSAAILTIDLDAIDQMPTLGSGDAAYKYNLPTLDDPTRVNNADGSDVNDPWGGNDGLNQAKLVVGGPVQIYSPGYRNIYDLVITRSSGREGHLYTIDNGPNQGWGGQPDSEGPWGTVTNNYVKGEPGSTGPGVNDPQVNNLDNLHYVGNIFTSAAGSHYGGHPTPIRANPSGAGLYTHDGTTGVFRTSTTGTNPLPQDWPPVPVALANPIEGDYQQPGVADQALLTFSTSTNGITEYTASNFNGALKGVLLAAGYNGSVYKILLTEDGTNVTNSKQSSDKLNTEVAFASGFGSQPLDITAQGDTDIFPGSVWAATYGSDAITVFEPLDMGDCTGSYSTLLDEDQDGYKNADEIDNSTDPCSASSKPNDFDLDFISDKNDPDDDNDEIADGADLFALDRVNGQTTYLPIVYDLFNNDPGTGFFGLGFTGLMNNGSNYSNLFTENNLIAGGAIGALSVVAVPAGDALGSMNSAKNGFQFGINTQVSDGPFTVEGRIIGPFFDNQVPQNFQSQGIYLGTGDQNNYLKIVLNANSGAGGIEVVYEEGGTATSFQYSLPGGIPASTLDLYLSVDPVAGTVQAKYAAAGGPVTPVGSPVLVAGALLTAMREAPSLAVGIISTCREATVFTATWDYIKVTADPVSLAGQWQTIPPSGASVIARHENGYVQSGDKFYLVGGRSIKAVQAFDPVAGTWASKGLPPIELHHFQAVELNGLIYVLGAFTGVYPHETPVPNVYIYNPVSDKWILGPAIPQARRRGSAAAVVHNNKIYLMCGILDGHWTGHVPWVDEYDPSTNTWRTLADAPRARDHFHAQVINGKIYVAGGRRTSGITNQVFQLTVPEVDIYNISTNTWTTLPAASNIPTMRAGTAAGVIDNELLIMGGESAQATAHNETEALNVVTNSWRTLADLQQGRHGSQAIVNNKNVYFVAGASSQGGSQQLATHEKFYFFAPSAPSGTALTESSLAGPSSVSFGTVALDSGKTQMVSLTNEGTNQSIVISSLNITGGAAFTASAPHQLPIVIPPRQSVVLTLNFNPTVAGTQTATLVVGHSGTGTSATISLNGNGEGPGLVASPASLHFFSQQAGTTSAAQAITLTNGTNESLSLSSVTISGTDGSQFNHDFAGVSSLAPGASKQVNVTFGPSSMGTKVAQLNIVHSAVNSPLTVALSGEGSGNPSSIVHQINSGGGPVVTSLGTFTEDKYFSPAPGSTYSKIGEISGTTDDELYYSERISSSGNGSFSYAIPVTNGSYNVVLLFAEIYWTATGKRIFDVSIEGIKVLDNYDIVAKAGAGTAIAETFPVSVADGVLNILFNAALAEGGKDRPKISGIRVISLSGTNEPPVANAGADISINLPSTSTVLDGSATDADGTVVAYLWQQESGPNTAVFSSTTVPKPTISGLVAGSYVFSLTAQDDLNAFSAPDQVTVTVSEAAQKVTSFTLMNAETEQVIQVIGNGSVLDLATLPTSQLNIRADTDPAVVGSVAFALIGAESKNAIESTAPYALFGHVAGDYNAWIPAPGDYTLAATPYSESEGAGEAGAGLTITFQVIDGATSNSPPIVGSPIPDQNATAGQLFSFVFGSNTFSDPDNDPLTYSSTLSDGSALPSWLTFTASTRTFNGTAPGAQAITIRVTASDGKGGSASDDFLLTVGESGEGSVVLRINSGGPDYVPSDGPVYAADHSFSGGKVYTNNNIADIAGTIDDVIYRSERYGSINYNIAVDPGTYIITLHFAEIYFGATGGGVGAVGKRVFNVIGEGMALLTNFDIYAEAGAMRAVKKSFQLNVSDGVLNISLAKIVDNPKISAIEIASGSTSINSPPVVSNTIPDQVGVAGELFTFTFNANTFSDPDGDVLNYSSVLANGSPLPAWLSFSSANRSFSGTPPDPQILSVDVVASDGKGGLVTDNFSLTVEASTEPIATRINSGGGGHTTQDGRVFSTDKFYSGGSTYTNTNITDITGTEDDAIYRSERYNVNSYNIPVQSGTYTLRLHFAEIYFGATGGGTGGVGKRVFNVAAEGNTLLTNFDIYAEVGAMAALVKEFVVDVPDGVLNINFTKVIQNVKISAIEVIPFSTMATTNSISTTTSDAEKMMVSPVTLEEQDPELAAYPNPFTTTTTLIYKPLHSQQISLQVFDMRGALVSDVHSGYVEAGGVYEYEVQASHLVDGVYFGRLVSEEKILFVRLVLER